MGSSPWRAIAEYHDNVYAALEQAQADVFERGAFGFAHRMTSSRGARGLPVADLPPEPIASSIEQAREIGGESGTYSVLDVVQIGSAPGSGVAGAATSEQLRSVVGSDKPTLSQLERVLDRFFEVLGRGEALYFTCHANAGEPAQCLFIGMSFD